jgi:hypothetical protein
MYSNSNNQTCSAVVSFNIVLSPQAVANTVNDYRLCNPTNDGFVTFGPEYIKCSGIRAQATQLSVRLHEPGTQHQPTMSILPYSPVVNINVLVYCAPEVLFVGCTTSRRHQQL